MNRYSSLKFVCDCLSEQVDRHALATRLSGMVEADWLQVIKQSSEQLLTPALFASLKRKQLLDNLPADVRDYFEAFYELNRQHNEEFLGDVIELGRAFNDKGVSPVLLKGGASLWDNSYGDPGSRMMSDIDMLLDPGELDDCRQVLDACGYHTVHSPETFDPTSPHLPPYYHSDKRIRIEIHREVLPTRYQSILPARDMLARARACERDGVTYKLPSPTHRVLHNIVHSSLDDGAYLFRRVGFRQLYDQYILRQRLARETDWSDIAGRMASPVFQAALQFALQSEQHFFLTPLPVEIKPDEQVAQEVAKLSKRINHPLRQKLRSFLIQFPSALAGIPRRLVLLCKYADYRQRAWTRLLALFRGNRGQLS